MVVFFLNQTSVYFSKTHSQLPDGQTVTAGRLKSQGGDVVLGLDGSHVKGSLNRRIDSARCVAWKWFDMPPPGNTIVDLLWSMWSSL